MLARYQKRRGGRERGSQILEFALSMPLMLIIVFAIFDFGSAVNIKQKLAGLTREAARMGANQSMSDLTSSTVATNGSVNDIRSAVSEALAAANLNDCGLATVAPNVSAAASFRWIYDAGSNGCPGHLLLTIERGYIVDAALPGGAVKVISTHVRLEYPFQWRLTGVIAFAAPGSTFAGPATISNEAVVQNLP